jgi:hypothetical protein
MPLGAESLRATLGLGSQCAGIKDLVFIIPDAQVNHLMRGLRGSFIDEDQVTIKRVTANRSIFNSLTRPAIARITSISQEMIRETGTIHGNRYLGSLF